MLKLLWKCKDNKWWVACYAVADDTGILVILLSKWIHDLEVISVRLTFLTLFYINMYKISQQRYSIFLSIIVKSTRVFPVFSVGQNEHKFVICLRVIVFTCNILIEYSVLHPEWTLRHDYSTKIGTLPFLFFHSVRHFRPTFYLIAQIICNNFWFVRCFDLSKCSE